MTKIFRGLLATFVATGLGVSSAAAQTMPPVEYMELARSIFVELIEINTTNTERGDNTTAARALARHLLDAGFPEGDVHVLVPDDGPTKGNLVARYRGRDTGQEPILLLAHIDVVEALPSDWSPDLNPFEFIERDGYYYGRGVTDDKDEAAIYVANFIRMKEEGFVPDRDIIVALTADEEGGPRNGVEFLLEEHRDLIDAAFALSEGGGGMEQNGRKISNNVQAAEKKFQSFTFTATNPGGHSSLPVRKNAIYHLSRALLEVQDFDFPVMLHEVTEAFFSGSAAIVGGDMGDAMRRILANPGDAQAAAILSGEPAYNSGLRTTCVATLLQGGHAQNALPQLAEATVNCRIFPRHDPEDVRAQLESLVDEYGVVVTPQGTATPSPSGAASSNPTAAISSTSLPTPVSCYLTSFWTRTASDSPAGQGRPRASSVWPSNRPVRTSASWTSRARCG